MTFFDPEDSFLDWLLKYAKDRIVYDLGCGSAEFLVRIWRRGIRGIGIDKNADTLIEDPEVRRRTLCADTTEFQPLRRYENALMLFCRPSHDGWVSKTIYKIHPSCEILYISKPGNRHVDLPGIDAKRLLAPGCRMEDVWQLLRPLSELNDRDYARAGIDRLIAMRLGNDLMGDPDD